MNLKGTYGRSLIAWTAIITALFLPRISVSLLAASVIATILISLINRECIPSLALASIVVAGGSLVTESVPAFSLWGGNWVLTLQSSAGIPVALELSLFTSRALVTYLLYGLVERDWRGMRLGVVVNLIISGVGLIALGVVGPRLSIHFHDAAVVTVLLWGVLLVANWVTAERILRLQPPREATSLVLLIGGCAFASAILAGSFYEVLRQDSVSPVGVTPVVAVFTPRSSDSLRDFGTSDSGFGLTNIGLYGDMPEFLTRLGYSVLEIDSLTEFQRLNVSCLYCPTFSRLLSDAEVAQVRAFLESGGSLVAVAEHTNLESNAEFLNALVKPYGLSVNFDNTNGLFGEGLTGTVGGRSRLADAVRSSPYLTHNRGASIRVKDCDGTPVLVGRFWQADRGDSLYPGRGYLSDGRLSTGDRIGNVVLMATATAGKGRIFLCGDSSPFLNQNLAYNAKFLSRLFEIMTGQTDREHPMLASVIVAVIFILLIAGLWAAPLPRHVLQYVMFVFLAVCTVGAVVIDWQVPLESVRLGDADWIIISTNENNAIDRDPFSQSAATGLALQIFRTGGLPVLADWNGFTPTPRAFFIINPMSVPSGNYLKDLSTLVESGVHAVIAGDGDNVAFERIVSHFGFHVTAEPVGSLADGEITTYTAWRVERVPSGARAIVVGGITIGGTATLGAGRVTVIADGGFLLSKNLETGTTFDEVNCRFVRSLLGESQQ